MSLEEILEEIRFKNLPYVYILKDGDIPFYVGKGGNTKRSWNRIAKHIRNARNTKKNIPRLDKIRQMDREGREVIYEIHSFHDTDNEAFEAEIALIDKIGRKELGKGPLLNYDDGGTGIRNVGPETRKKMREAKLGRTLSEEHRRKLSESKKGRTFSEETKRKIAEAHRGQKRSKEAKEKMRQAKLGKKQSPEAIAKRMESRKKYYENLTDEQREELKERAYKVWEVRRKKYGPSGRPPK